MDDEKGNEESQVAREVIERYSLFTTAEKWCIIGMVAYAAWFSTLSSFIYFPALHVLSETFGVSVAKINLTITSYMAIATIAPTLVGDAADVGGRRLVYVITLSLYIGANIGIALSKLISSGTFSIAYGVVNDIASPAERGSFLTQLTSITIAPSIGPILGGVLTYAADWSWIFWFLSIAAGIGLTTMIFLLPETSRNLVGNGSTRPPKYLRLPIRGLMRHWNKSHIAENHKWRTPNPLKSLKILARKDNIGIIIACGFLYTVYTCLNVSLSILFIDIYKLNQWQAGLIYLPFGIGGSVSTTARGLLTDKAVGGDLDNFPVEKARLGVIWIPMLLTAASVLGFGWVLHFHKVRFLHIAIPLCIQFIIGLCMQLDFSIYNTLLGDKNHRTPAAAQASSNIVRCTFAAIAISFLQGLIDAIGIGWTFTILSGMCLLAMSLFFLDYWKGTRWRQESLRRFAERRGRSDLD
ncbi:major facilitator superfamily domain-containing protein [Hyaloscypha finlandica]|nr:major facilitator superfamily domain-containing protein [Hyaloscypha finlandica]